MKNISGVLIVLSFILFGCDDGYVSSIPSYPVNLQLNLTSTYPTFKNSTNEFLLFEERYLETDRIGFGGILVCTGSGFDDYGNSLYYAFDLACPYEAKKGTKVRPLDDELGKVMCDSCGSVYDVSYGYGIPISGPSKEVLKKYKTSLSGDILYIYK